MIDVNALTLKVITPRGEQASVSCDSVTVFARDGENNDGGGSVGIRRGHLPAVIALLDGCAVKASSGGAPVAAYTVSDAFAIVKDDVVTVVAESVS